MSASEIKVETKFRCMMTAGRIPKFGDGTIRFPRMHRIAGVICEGVYDQAEWVDPEEPRQPAPQPRGDLAG